MTGSTAVFFVDKKNGVFKKEVYGKVMGLVVSKLTPGTGPDIEYCMVLFFLGEGGGRGTLISI